MFGQTQTPRKWTLIHNNTDQRLVLTSYYSRAEHTRVTRERGNGGRGGTNSFIYSACSKSLKGSIAHLRFNASMNMNTTVCLK